MACRVIRNDQDTIVSVLAPNGNESLLFNSILNDVKDSEEALLEYSTTYTSGFQTVVGNTFTNVDPQDLYDSNGEISFKVYDRLMNPERHINQMYNPDKTNLLNKKDPNLRYIQKVGSFLSEKFGYDYDIIYDTENKNKGYVDIDNYDKPTIVVNAAYATEDTVLHEYAHIFIAQIRASNKQLFSTLIKEIENTEEGKRELLAVQNFYPNLSFEEQVEEAIVELLGKYASGYFDPKSGIHRALTKIWNTIKQYIEKAFNLKISELNPNTNISDLAKILAHPTIRFREQSFAQSTLESVIERSNNNLNDEVQFLNELSQIDSPSIIKLGNYDFILNEEAYNNYLSILTNRINAIRDYITSYRFETEIKSLDKQNKFYYSNRDAFIKNELDNYPLLKEILPLLHPSTDTALWVLQDALKNNTLQDSVYKDIFNELDEDINKKISLAILYDRNTGLAYDVKNFIKAVRKPWSVSGNIIQIIENSKNKIAELQGYIANPKAAPEYYRRSKNFSIKDDTYSVNGTYNPSSKNINISFSSSTYGMKDVNEGKNFSVLPKVVSTVIEMFDDVDYDTISFTPVNSSTGKRQSTNELRLKTYNLFAKRLFGKYSLIGQTENETVIPIPDIFKNKLSLSKTVFQRVREENIDDQSELKEESENIVNENEVAFTTVKKIADSFSERFGIGYNIIDENEARKMLNEAGFAYDNEPAFFFNGEVYITTGNFNPKNVIHEFSHPFIKAIAKNNPVLFNKLYNELSQTEEGKRIIKYVENKYKDKDSEGKKEEVLVRALTERAIAKSNFTENTPEFTSIINKILYHIKQFMRKVFGKIKIENLDVNTTLEDLSEMLTTESLNLSIRDAIATEVEFNRETGRSASEFLKKAERIKLEQGVNTFFDLLKKNSSIIRDGLTQDNDLYEVFVDSEIEKNRIFSDTIRNLSKYTTLDSTSPLAVDDAIKYRELQINAFINSLVEYEDAIDRIGEEIGRIRSSSDPNEFAITRLDYLKRILKSTLETTDQIKKDFVEQNVDVSSPVFRLVNEMEDKAKIGVSSIYNYFEKILPPILAPQLEGTNKMIIKEYDEAISNLRKKGADAASIQKLEKERESYLRDENYLARAIVGTEPEPPLLGMSAFVESAISSPDGLISSFAKMVKSTMINVDLNAKKNADEFFDAVNPLIEKANVNFNNISEAGNKMTTVQKKGYTDPTTGEFATREVVEFLNPFKDYQLALSEFAFEIREAIKEGDQDKLVDIKKRKRAFYRQYMHNEFLPIVYTADDIFEKTFMDSKGVVHEVGKIAKERRDKILEQIAAENGTIKDELEKLEISSRMKSDALWSDYYALYSKYTPDSKIKDEVELAITNILLENRKKRMSFYAWETDDTSDSMPIKRFEKARKLFKERLLVNYPETSKEYKEKLAEWDKVNTRVVVDKTFYADRQVILDDIRDIYAQITAAKVLSPEDEEKITKTQNKIQKNMEEILDQMYGYRDEENHPNGLLISEEKVARLKVVQEEINELRETLRNGEALSKAEKLEMQKLLDKEDEEGLTPEESDRLDFLDTQNVFSNVPKSLRKKLSAKFKELNEIQSKYSTKYYMIAYNYQLERLNERLKAAGAADRKLIKLLDSLNVDELSVDQGFLNKAFKDKIFKNWFENNHVLAIFFDPESKRYEERYQRLPIWNEVRPNDENKYLRKMVLSDGETIFGMPTLNYYRQNVKPEFITPEIDENGLPTRDVNGKFLPRLIPNSPYINQDYFDLKNKDEKLFDLLNKITEMHLKFQQNDDEGKRLGYEVPRFERSSKELTETTAFISGKVSGAKTVIKNIINKFRKNPEDFDEGLSNTDKFTLVSLDQFDNDDGKIHIAGKSFLDQDQVSRDVITSVLRHMWGIERFSELKKIHPVAKALNDVLQDPKNLPKDTSKVSMYHLINKGAKVFAPGKTTSARAKAVKGMIDKNFYNIQQTGLGSDAVFLQKLSRYMMAGASFGFFALDIVSALKNRFGQQIQQTVELAAGTSYDAKSFLKGKLIASKAMMEITGSIYSRGKLPLLAQMVDIFDPVQGRFYEKFAQRMTRTVFKDAASPLNATMSPRKFLELEVGLEFFFGVMEFTKVERTIGATKELIPYTEAFELVDGKIQLRSGIDPKYDIGGSEFKRIRLFIQEKQNILNGVYSIFDQPEGSRYLFYRMYLFLRKFFVTGFMNRFGFSGSIFKPRYRRNEATESLEMGYWINTLDAAIQMIRSGGKHMHTMLPQQKRAVYKSLAETAILMIASMVIPSILGWDDDDEDRYEKLRERQGGPLGSDKFKLGGWMANHILYQSLSVSSENSQFYTVKFYSEMLSDFNLANGPTLETYAKMLENFKLWITDDPGAYYKKDVGPYPWQKAESAKIANNLGKAFALTGKNIDPAKAVQDFISIQTIK